MDTPLERAVKALLMSRGAQHIEDQDIQVAVRHYTAVMDTDHGYGVVRSPILDAIRDARAVLAAVSGWQPISTAPTDKNVLAFMPGNKHRFIARQRTHKVKFGQFVPINPPDWVDVHDGRKIYAPAMWQPLPRAPQEGE